MPPNGSKATKHELVIFSATAAAPEERDYSVDEAGLVALTTQTRPQKDWTERRPASGRTRLSLKRWANGQDQ
jgi:hypothetical protein